MHRTFVAFLVAWLCVVWVGVAWWSADRRRRLRTRSCAVEGDCRGHTTCRNHTCLSYADWTGDAALPPPCRQSLAGYESFYFGSSPDIVRSWSSTLGGVGVAFRRKTTDARVDYDPGSETLLRVDGPFAGGMWTAYCPWVLDAPTPATGSPVTPPVDRRQLSFENPDGGAWKQGWDVPPKAGPIQIVVLPHSHCDPGWIKTFDEYFQTQTRHILDSAVAALLKDRRRTFVWAEISYFEWWWREQTTEARSGFKELLANGQWEFVTGGWVMPDEANTALYALEVQLDEGHDWLNRTFGVQPEYGWSIDPFGYSPTMPYLLQKRGFKGALIQRVHYAVKKVLASKRQLEFRWRQTWDPDGEHDLFTHLMPFYSYDVPHTCGPDPSVCCQFDFARLNGYGGCPWGKRPQPITASNVAERGALLLDQYRKKSSLYAHNVVLAPLGDDFRYQTASEAEAQFTNYQQLMDWMKDQPGVSIRFGTLKDYFEALPTFDAPVLKGSFFTYADRDDDYWSGYFTSRVFDKALDRRLESSLQAAESMGATGVEMRSARRSLALFQHHDGVTGTSKNGVVSDYAKRLSAAIRRVQDWMGATMGGQSCWEQVSPRTMWTNACASGTEVTVYNPLEWPREWCGKTVPAKGTARGTAGCGLRCSWSGRPYVHPYWARGDAFVKTIEALNDAGVVYFLTDGALIGAYRHGGPVPCDGDMDIVFPTWLNGLADCEDVKDGRPTLRGYETNDESNLTLCGKTREDYVAMAGDWLRRKVPSLRSIAPRSFGGLRVDLAGVGVDWIVSILDQSYLHDGPMCRCRFGATWAWCLEGSLPLLKRIYGDSVLTPDSKARACREPTRWVEPPSSTIDQPTGLVTHPFREEWMVYDVRRGGAYLFVPATEARPHSEPRSVHGWTTTAPHWSRTVVERGNGVYDLEYEVELTERNEEWFVRLETGVRNQGVFHTDLNGFNFDTHVFRKDRPIQAQVYPMPTLACIEDGRTRFTVLSEHAQGVASLSDGTIDVWLDRRLGQDDERGVGQGVEDNVRVRTTLRVVVEEGVGMVDAFAPTEWVKKQWDELNRPLEMFRETTPPIPIVILAHQRVEYMKQTMESIGQSDLPNHHPILVSHDGHVPEMMDYLDSIEPRFNLTRIYHPWACYDHPHSFPANDSKLNEGYAGDQYGHPRSEWATCAKHHWWWMMQTVWDLGYDTIVFTEEDYEVAPTIYQTITTGLGLCTGDCFGVLLQPNGREVGDVWVEEAFQTGPMVLRRSSWEALWAAKKDFCEFDDYGWDWSVVHTMAVGNVPFKMVAPGKRQVRHIGAKGMHGREVAGAALGAFGGTELLRVAPQRPANHRGNGGWGHPADQTRCGRTEGLVSPFQS